jgi:predicted phosphate transport protein (TIGR00153 family)
MQSDSWGLAVSFFKRFARSPFEPLTQLLQGIGQCVDHLEPMIEANIAGDFDAVKEHFKAITRAEHEVDELKDSIRDNLPSSIFLPVDRGQFLNIIGMADDIADCCEDIGYLLTVRHTHVPVTLQAPFRALVGKSLEAYRQLRTTIDSFDELVDTGFAKPLAQEMMAGIQQVCHLEWEADKLGYKFSQALFELESQLSPVDIFMLHDIANVIGKFADANEKLAKELRKVLAH